TSPTCSSTRGHGARERPVTGLGTLGPAWLAWPAAGQRGPRRIDGTGRPDEPDPRGAPADVPKPPVDRRRWPACAHLPAGDLRASRVEQEPDGTGSESRAGESEWRPPPRNRHERA